MAGGDDAQPHQAANPGPAASSSPEELSKQQSATMAKTGEVMLGFALAIVFVVILCVTLHLILKQRRRTAGKGGNKNKKTKKRKKKDADTKATTELHSNEKKIYEAAGTQVVLCELPEDAPPLQELEAAVIFPFLPLERRMTGMSTRTSMTGTTTSEIEFNPGDFSPEDPWPEGRQLAAYWSMR